MTEYPESELRTWTMDARAHRVRYGLRILTTLDFLIGHLACIGWTCVLQKATGSYVSPERFRHLGKRFLQAAPAEWLTEAYSWGMRGSEELSRVIEHFKSLRAIYDENEYVTEGDLFGLAL